MDSSRNEINRMIRLVEELLLLARLEAGKDTLTMGIVQLDEVMLSVVSRIQKLAEKKSVQIKTAFQSERKDQELCGTSGHIPRHSVRTSTNSDRGEDLSKNFQPTKK